MKLRSITLRPAMTLIELCTATCTASIMIAMVLPAMSSAHRQTKETKCLKNLHQVAQACAAYAAGDRDENAIPVHPLIGVLESANGEIEWGGKSGIGGPQRDDYDTGAARCNVDSLPSQPRFSYHY